MNSTSTPFGPIHRHIPSTVCDSCFARITAFSALECAPLSGHPEDQGPMIPTCPECGIDAFREMVLDHYPDADLKAYESNRVQHIEVRMLDVLFATLLEANIIVEVWSGGPSADCISSERLDLFDHITACDETNLVLRREGKRLGFIELVFGNDGFDLIVDHTDTPEIADLVKPAEDFGTALEAFYVSHS